MLDFLVGKYCQKLFVFSSSSLMPLGPPTLAIPPLAGACYEYCKAMLSATAMGKKRRVMRIVVAPAIRTAMAYWLKSVKGRHGLHASLIGSDRRRLKAPWRDELPLYGLHFLCENLLFLFLLRAYRTCLLRFLTSDRFQALDCSLYFFSINIRTYGLSDILWFPCQCPSVEPYGNPDDVIKPTWSVYSISVQSNTEITVTITKNV